MIKLSRVAVGWYASKDGKWAVVGDGADAYVSQAEADGAGVGAGWNTSAEWQVLYSETGGLREDSNAGARLEWVGTLREGRARVQVYAARRAH